MAFNQKASIETHTFFPERGGACEHRLSLLYPWLVSFQPGKERQSKRRGSYWWCGSRYSPWYLSEGRFVNEEREPPSQQTFSPSFSHSSSSSPCLWLSPPVSVRLYVRANVCVCLQHALAVIHPPSLPPCLAATPSILSGEPRYQS